MAAEQDDDEGGLDVDLQSLTPEGLVELIQTDRKFTNDECLWSGKEKGDR